MCRDGLQSITLRPRCLIYLWTYLNTALFERLFQEKRFQNRIQFLSNIFQKHRCTKLKNKHTSISGVAKDGSSL